MTRFERCRRRRPQRRVVDTKNHRQKIKLNFILITTTNCLCVVKRIAWHSSGKKNDMKILSKIIYFHYEYTNAHENSCHLPFL